MSYLIEALWQELLLAPFRFVYNRMVAADSKIATTLQDDRPSPPGEKLIPKPRTP